VAHGLHQKLPRHRVKCVGKVYLEQQAWDAMRMQQLGRGLHNTEIIMQQLALEESILTFMNHLSR
jgi:hypothetical protein